MKKKSEPLSVGVIVCAFMLFLVYFIICVCYA